MKLTIQDALNKAIESHKAGKLQEADKFYTAILKAQPKHPDANHNMGVLAVAVGKVEEGLPFFKKALEVNPKIAQFWLSYVDALIKLDRIIEAKTVYDQAKDKELKKDVLKQLEERINRGQQEVINTPKNQDPPGDKLQYLVKLYEQGQLNKGLKIAEELLKQFPHSTMLYNNIGIFLSELGYRDKAINSYKKSIKIKPDNVIALNNLGNALNINGQKDEAVESFRSAIKIKPDYAEAHYNLGKVFQDNGDLQKAIDSYKATIKIKPDFLNAYNNMGSALLDKGDTDKAIDSYKKALGIDPNSNQISMNLSNAKSKSVPLWHLPMLNDQTRNSSYFKAIESAIKGQELVLDIGTGSGLLSMMAADLGAKKIFACEVSTIIAETAKKIIQQNGYKNRINVINKNSTDLIIGKDLPRKADLLISEILANEFVGEGIQKTIIDAKKRLLKPKGKIIPESGAIMVSLIENTPEIASKLFVDQVRKYNLSEFNSISQSKFMLALNNNPNFLSDPKIAFHFDFYNYDRIITEEKKIKFTTTREGVCAGIIQWIKVILYEDIEYENNPIKIDCTKLRSHWLNPIYRFDRPIKLGLGQMVEIQASLFKDSIWFNHNK